ncbi:MAG: DNA mismatch repair endonuclease MutL [Cytophagales bacterium]|nr:MAG: DNA mismatch repair endonuclease MutL [Cytophagales bacterium]
MQDIIRLLPESIANQIAAGEVVQRPASVVKELLENAVDAQSTAIQLIIKNAGKTHIQVVDNGIGMSETDARMCFERHATSKIKQTDDLFRIQTMGFRGEALASIAAVAEVELKTKRQEDTLGTYIAIEGSKLRTQEGISAIKGTSFVVKNLFYNIPARKNFLKSNQVELKHIYDEFIKIALSHPEIEFICYQDDQETYHLEKTKLSQRIIDLFGKNYRQNLIPCQEESSLLHLKGYIGKPQVAKKTRGEQFFFINQRFVKYNYLHYALMQAYDKLLPADTFPFYVLFLEVDPKTIDVNVHPQKIEVKLEDERAIFAMLESAIKRTLSTHHLSPSLDFETDANYHLPIEQRKEGEQKFKLNLNRENQREKSNLLNWKSIYDNLSQKAIQQEHFKTDEIENLFIYSKINQPQNENETINTHKQWFKQIFQQYIITPMPSGLVIIDQEAAHQRILYEQLRKQYHSTTLTLQTLLFPVKITFNANDWLLFLEIEKEIRNLGFIFEVLEKEKAIMLQTMPANLAPEHEEKQYFEQMIEQFKNSVNTLNIDRQDVWLYAMAKKAAIKNGKILQEDEMKALTEQLFASSNPNYTPEGRVICMVMNAAKMSQLFQE